MKVKDLIDLLNGIDPEADVVVNDNGSIYETASRYDTLEYNKESDTGEFYIVTAEWE